MTRIHRAGPEKEAGYNSSLWGVKGPPYYKASVHEAVDRLLSGCCVAIAIAIAFAMLLLLLRACYTRTQDTRSRVRTHTGIAL